MSEQTINCPKCGAEIELSEALTNKIRQGLRTELQSEAQKQQEAILQREASLKAKETQLEEDKARLDQAVHDRVEAERRRLAAEAVAKAEADYRVKSEGLEKELAEKSAKLGEAQRLEIELRRQQRVLQEKQEEQQLEIERTLDQERKAIRQKAMDQATEEQRLKAREKDDLIESLRTQVGELQRKMQVGSQERQGEALEGDLLDTLRAAFPFDECEEVTKGVRGADILQRVRNEVGRVCGTILWESKSAKDFSRAWVDKLKLNQQEAKADVAVLLTAAMPKNIKSFDFCDDVWITDYASAMSLCASLRQTVIQVDRERQVSAHKGEMKDVVFGYISGPEFSRRVKAIVTAYKQMHEDLESEKRAMTRIWKKRESQISLVLGNVTEMYGQLEGMLGEQKLLPAVEPLELESIAPEMAE